MGKSLIACVFSFAFAFDLTAAGSHDTLEPYQILDIRMQEGVQDAFATRHDLGVSSCKVYSAFFLQVRKKLVSTASLR